MSNHVLAGASLVGLVSVRPRLTRAVTSTLVGTHGFTAVTVEDLVRRSVEETDLLTTYGLQEPVGALGWDDTLTSREHGARLRVLIDTYRRARPAREWADMLTAAIYDLGGPGPQAPIVVPDAGDPAIAERLRDLGGAIWGVGSYENSADITIRCPPDLMTLGGDVDRALRWSALAHRASLLAA